MLNFLKNISPTELLIIAFILIVFFGSRIVTRLAKTGGETLRELKNVKKTFTEAAESGNKSKKEVS